MFGLSDTTLGVITSVALHAGVVAACFGPLGEGTGAGEIVVTVSIDGVEVSPTEGELLRKVEPEQPNTRIADTAPGGSSSKPDPRVEPPRSQVSIKPKSLPKKREQPPQAPRQDQAGGGGLLGALFTQPRLLSIPKPAYPHTARERGVEGKVGIRVLVSPQGGVERAEVVNSSGLESFDSAALESALAAKFAPGLQAGIPSAAEKTIVVTFSLLE
jgi:TonB family protein